jgi:hypothetical protein
MVCTKPNIAQAMGVVNHFMANLGQSHWIVIKQIFHYLKGTMVLVYVSKETSRMLLWVKYILTRMLTIVKSRHV